MPHLLKNDNLEISIDFPAEGYKSSRFDYTGKITTVMFRGTTIVTTEQLNSPNEDYLGKGLYNEFGIDSALGYNEAAKDEWFHKVGVGLLRKDDNIYQFNKNYEIKLADFNVQTEQHKVIISCKSELVNGYSYYLRKEIEIQESSLKISYFLENTGVKNIYTTEYNHNFVAINNELVGSSYELRFPFELQPDKFEESVNPENSVECRPNSIFFNKNPTEQFFFSSMNGKVDVPAHWELLNHRHKIGISETGNFNTEKVNLWGWKHVISSELFFKISLKPNETTEWSRTYKFFKTT
jgi:hypothetical protein